MTTYPNLVSTFYVTFMHCFLHFSWTQFLKHLCSIQQSSFRRLQSTNVRNRLRDELWSKGFRRPSESDKNKNVVRRDKYNRVVDPDRNSPEIS